ncbi:thermonuclease family protein [Pseudonocardia sp. MH-G8]|uniref:thermonuclease family protein n=1 Tax=Pseudonocardia sp. MH-G8 TaxID=1854588 RepID=UPI000BA150A5|nr:thermonuclease family protein [Pseudonocardia sp. MH-G8]OZM77534.1 hypothetical protein CFP66_35855 [Pseudonocardia sp. MH-G8]
MLTLLKFSALALTAAGATTVAVVVAQAAPASTAQAVVTKVVDGDTIDVTVDGRGERVRMLNIDTPEITGPEVQCLGPEAAAHLAELLPVGTPVVLEFDEERTDGYDRTLAGVRTRDGALVNAEMARAGLAVPLVVGDNDRFLPPVQQARDEAAAQGRGLFSPEITCTVPAQVATVTAAAEQAPAAAAQPPGASSAELATSASLAVAAVTTARALEDALVRDAMGLAWAVFTPDERDRLLQDVRDAAGRAEREAGALREAEAAATAQEAEAARVEEQRRAEEQRRTEERQAEERRAEEQRQAREAAERREAREAAARQEAREAAERQAREAQSQSRSGGDGEARPSAPDAGGSGAPSGYTGPRCYAPGGKTWKPC